MLAIESLRGVMRIKHSWDFVCMCVRSYEGQHSVTRFVVSYLVLFISVKSEYSRTTPSLRRRILQT